MYYYLQPRDQQIERIPFLPNWSHIHCILNNNHKPPPSLKKDSDSMLKLVTESVLKKEFLYPIHTNTHTHQKKSLVRNRSVLPHADQDLSPGSTLTRKPRVSRVKNSFIWMRNKSTLGRSLMPVWRVGINSWPLPKLPL
jgi:hypothetical protein